MQINPIRDSPPPTSPSGYNSGSRKQISLVSVLSQLYKIWCFPRKPKLTYVVSQGDVSSSGEQHTDHLNVLVLGSPDNGGPTSIILNKKQEEQALCDRLRESWVKLVAIVSNQGKPASYLGIDIHLSRGKEQADHLHISILGSVMKTGRSIILLLAVTSGTMK